MKTAISSRDLIGQAKDILMERYEIGAAEALGLLVVASQRASVKRVSRADLLVRSRELATVKS